jgi:sporulation protein YlmC with PRC-barrel domain
MSRAIDDVRTHRLRAEFFRVFRPLRGTAAKRPRSLIVGEQEKGNRMSASATAADPKVRETANLIASDKVEGTPVYRANGDKIGKIERIMLEKRTGTVAYAVMTFGGFLGIGDDYYPVPWKLLRYNEQLGGYEAEITDVQLKSAPKFRTNDSWAYGDRQREAAMFSYYGVTPSW